MLAALGQSKTYQVLIHASISCLLTMSSYSLTLFWTGDEAYRKRQAMSGGAGGPAAMPAVMDMQVPFLVLQLMVQALTKSNSTDA